MVWEGRREGRGGERGEREKGEGKTEGGIGYTGSNIHMYMYMHIAYSNINVYV